MSPVSSDAKGNEPASSPSGSFAANTNQAANHSKSPNGNSQLSPSQQTQISLLDVNSVIADTYRDLTKGEEYATMIENKLNQFDEKVKLFYASLGIEWDPNEEVAASDDGGDEGEEHEPQAEKKKVKEVNGEDKEHLRHRESEEELKILELMDSFVVAHQADGGGNGKDKA